MTFEDLLDSQLKYVEQCFSDFEALKRCWMRSQGHSDGFAEYQDHDKSEPPELLSPFHEEESHLQAYEDEEPMEEKPWNRTLAFDEAEHFHSEVAPPRLFTDYSMIDPEDPDFGRGVELGIPSYVSLHVPRAGFLNFPGYGRE